MYNYIKYLYDNLYTELYFTLIITLEFFIYISLIYDIFKNTKISVLAKKVTLINPFYLTITFFFVFITPFKYLKLNFSQKIVDVIHYLVILSFIIFLYRYMQRTIIYISTNLLTADFGTKKAYKFFKLLNLLTLILLICYIGSKIILVFINPEYELYFEIPLNTFIMNLNI